VISESKAGLTASGEGFSSERSGSFIESPPLFLERSIARIDARVSPVVRSRPHASLGRSRRPRPLRTNTFVGKAAHQAAAHARNPSRVEERFCALAMRIVTDEKRS